MAKIDPNEPCPCSSGKLFKECHGPKVNRAKPEIKTKIKLSVIPEPDPNTRSVFEKSGESTLFIQGHSSTLAFTCGKCNSVLVAGVEKHQIKGIVLKCNNCNSFNDT